MTLSPEARTDLIRRMRRIEGQTQGIQRMLEEGRDCREVLNQLASVRAATHSVSVQLARHYARALLGTPEGGIAPDGADEIVEFLLSLPR